jgi:hypothetical protein
LCTASIECSTLTRLQDRDEANDAEETTTTVLPDKPAIAA